MKYRVRKVVAPKDSAAVRMQFEKTRKEKREHRNPMQLGQAQNLKDTYTSLMVRPHELNPRHLVRARDQVHTLLKKGGALRPNFIPN